MADEKDLMMEDAPVEYMDLDTIQIPLEDGTEVDCAILEEFEYNDVKYMILAPIDEEANIVDDYFAYRYTEDGEDIILDYIEDEAELALVDEIWAQLQEADAEEDEFEE